METINSFQSSLPVGGATTILEVKPDEEVISIHAPRGGSDNSLTVKLWYHTEFQSTLPVGGATRDDAERIEFSNISIHAPRGGSDIRFAASKHVEAISIHAPRGGSDRS